MTKRLFKTFLALSLIASVHIDAKSKCETFCSALIQKCLTVQGNETVRGNLDVLGNLTVGGVPVADI